MKTLKWQEQRIKENSFRRETARRLIQFDGVRYSESGYSKYAPETPEPYIDPTPWHKRLDDSCMISYLLHLHEYDPSARFMRFMCREY